MSVGLPATVYRSTDGLSEWNSEAANNIVDTLGNNLVDTVGNQIVDTGVVKHRIPSTIWGEYGEVTGDGYPVVYMAVYT